MTTEQRARDPSKGGNMSHERQDCERGGEMKHCGVGGVMIMNYMELRDRAGCRKQLTHTGGESLHSA